MKIYVVGAGKTGRGFVSRLCKESNKTVTFVDKNKELVKKLNEKKNFEVSFFGDVKEKITVDGFEAYTWENVDMSDAELVFVSVGGQNLSDVAIELKTRLPLRKCAVIACENATNPADKLKSIIAMDNVRVSEATVFCTTVENGELDILSEPYPYLQFNKELLGDFDTEIKAVKPIDNFPAFLTRKLFTYNAASCLIAYLGALKGYTDYAQAANDKDILCVLDENYEQTNRAMCIKYGYDTEDQKEFARLSKNKFCSTVIRDSVERNGRDPVRKLCADERIIGPMKLIYSYGVLPIPLIKTAAAALLFDLDEKFCEYKKENPPERILTGLCGLDKNGELFEKIMYYVNNPEEII